MEKHLDKISIHVTNLPVNTTSLIVPSTLSLVVEGGVDVISTLTAADIIATIDYEREHTDGVNEFPVEITPLPEIRFRDISPQLFKIVLKRTP